ncbi:MAG: SRPBCC domain-containing protein [Saprospiraceae bacterium]|nr:SRPBCC domain-containing protein [Saprospiraceae bacterium]
MELKDISPIEKVGYEKINHGHWVTHTEIIIDATPEQVWSVLTDTEGYGNWNDIILKIDGKIEDKGKVDVLFKAGPKAKPQLFHHNELHVEEGVEFYWSDVATPIIGIKDRHCFRVELFEENKTRFIQSDQAKGGLTWLFGKMAEKIQLEVYPIFNRALKAEVERRYPKT